MSTVLYMYVNTMHCIYNSTTVSIMHCMYNNAQFNSACEAGCM